jgi:hypothetical protein
MEDYNGTVWNFVNGLCKNAEELQPVSLKENRLTIKQTIDNLICPALFFCNVRAVHRC